MLTINLHQRLVPLTIDCANQIPLHSTFVSITYKHSKKIVLKWYLGMAVIVTSYIKAKVAECSDRHFRTVSQPDNCHPYVYSHFIQELVFTTFFLVAPSYTSQKTSQQLASCLRKLTLPKSLSKEAQLAMPAMPASTYVASYLALTLEIIVNLTQFQNNRAHVY